MTKEILFATINEALRDDVEHVRYACSQLIQALDVEQMSQKHVLFIATLQLNAMDMAQAAFTLGMLTNLVLEQIEEEIAANERRKTNEPLS